MKKLGAFLAASVCGLALPVSAVASDSAVAPSTVDSEGTYRFNPSLSLVAGLLDQHVTNANSAKSIGAEIRINSPFRSSLSGRLLHSLSVTGSSSAKTNPWDSSAFSLGSFEFNTYYLLTLNGQLDYGFGAGVSKIRIKQDAYVESYSASGVQLNALLEYKKAKWLYGAEVRHQLTGEFERLNTRSGFGDRTAKLPNTRLLLKLGYRFSR